MARSSQDTLGSTPLEVFIPAAGENPDDPGDTQRDAFLTAAQELLDEGLDIAVYSTDSYPSAFTDCEPVADQLAMAGGPGRGLVHVPYRGAAPPFLPLW